MPLIVEVKARCERHDALRDLLHAHGARFVGEDHQIDTYFDARYGRLKFREGTIERNLIAYDRAESAGLKTSQVRLYTPPPGSALKELLTQSLGVVSVVDKRRAIYFIDNVKFHLDQVEGLGRFVEIEAIDTDGSRSHAQLHAQCTHFVALFEIVPGDLVSGSYADLLRAKAGS